MNEKKESFAKKVKRESNGFSKLDPDFVQREKDTQTKYLIMLHKKMGRALTEKELRELGNIL